MKISAAFLCFQKLRKHGKIALAFCLSHRCDVEGIFCMEGFRSINPDHMAENKGLYHGGALQGKHLVFLSLYELRNRGKL